MAPNYTQIPNAVIDAMAKMHECELKVVMAICRKTFGWHKATDVISLSQLEALTGLSRQGVIDGVARATHRGIVERIPDGQSFAYRVIVYEDDAASQPSRLAEDGLVNVVDQQPVNVVDQLPPELVNVVDTQKKDLNKDIKKAHTCARSSKSEPKIPAPEPLSTPPREDPAFGAAFSEYEHEFGRLSFKERCAFEDLWDEYPLPEAHAHARQTMKKDAKFYNLAFYASAVRSFTHKHYQKVEGGHDGATDGNSATPMDSERGAGRAGIRRTGGPLPTRPAQC